MLNQIRMFHSKVVAMRAIMFYDVIFSPMKRFTFMSFHHVMKERLLYDSSIITAGTFEWLFTCMCSDMHIQIRSFSCLVV